MNKAYKFIIFPTLEQEEMFTKTFGSVRWIYNKMLADKIEYYKENKKYLKLTPAMYKKDNAFLYEVDSLALCNASINLEKAYKNFFEKKADFPRFKSKKDTHCSYTTNFVNNNIVLKEDMLKLPKIGEVKIKKHREISEEYKLKSVTISKDSMGRYFASIVFEYEEVVAKKEITVDLKIVGLDFSMQSLYVSSDNENANYPKYYRQAEEKVKKQQRKVSKCEKGSENRQKEKIKLSKKHDKVKNQRLDFLHKLSRQIAGVSMMLFV